MPEIRKVLIANRGEIATRVIRALREAGIGSVAIYSDPDRLSPHVTAADEAVALGGQTSAESYLVGEKILEAARRTGCDALHPGYGFLSENAEFTEAVAAAGITFIGPSPEALRLMGDKVEARRTAKRLGVPVIPGSDGSCASAEEATAAAREAGFPVVLKARGGGGGKGIRLVEDEASMAEALARAASEAAGAFGQADIYVEKLITGARHIEIQVLGDGQGNAVHLAERECSLQRRHQKLIEECPSPSVDAALRQQLSAAAVALTAGIRYANAGTVEFLVDAEGGFYFLEMNTRLQVEHPVTELVTGVDLVAAQLHIAATASLPISQQDVSIRGHAIEARIYAEDPFSSFLPSAGRIEALQLPGGPHVRVDHALAHGQEISTFYDPMLAKLCVWAEDRRGAIARMKQASEEFVVSGLDTTLPLVTRLCSEPDFIEGRFDTGWLEPFVQRLAAAGGAASMPAGASAELAEQRTRAAAIAAVLTRQARDAAGNGNAVEGLPMAPRTLSPWVAQGRPGKQHHWRHGRHDY